MDDTHLPAPPLATNQRQSMVRFPPDATPPEPRPAPPASAPETPRSEHRQYSWASSKSRWGVSTLARGVMFAQRIFSSAASGRRAGRVRKNPVLATFFPADSSRFKALRFGLTTLIAVGCTMVVAAVLVLMIFPAIVRLEVIGGTHLGPETACFERDPDTCTTVMKFDYYLHHVTNLEGYLAGEEPPIVEEVGPYSYDVTEVRFNTKFTKTDVTYNQLFFQEFNREDSCEKCDLDGPPIIAPNRGYLALLGAMGNSEYALLLAGAPTAFEGLFAGIQSVFTAVGFPPEAVPAAALAQFGQCNQLGVIHPALFSLVDGVNPDPTLSLWPATAPIPEICGWAARVAGVPQEFAAVSPQTAGLVAGMLSGTYEGPGAMPPTSFAIYFATAPAAALATTWGMPETEVSLVQGFLMYLALGAVEPTYRAKYINDDMQAGLLVARTPRELIEGFVDPMLGDFSGWDNPTSRVEHAIAYTATFETIEAAVGMPLSEASHETGPKVRHRVLYRGVDDDKWTGRMRATRGDTHVAMPRGTVKVDGLWSGNTNFGTHIEVGQRFHVWSEELGGRVIVWEAVGEEEVEGLQTMRLELAEETFRACGEGEGDAGPGHPACLTPDTVRGAWDQADVYKAPAVRTLPDFARSDLAASGARSAAPSKAGTWFINVDVNTGYPVRGSTAFQLSHRLSRTERFYPTLYQSPEGTGVWVPTHAINVHYTVGDKSFSDLRGLRALLDMTEAIAIALIVVGVLLAVPAALLTAFLPSMRERRRLLAECTRSTAPPSALYGEEEAKSARVPTARRGYKGTRVDELRKEVSSGRSGAGGSVAPESTLGASSTEMGE